MLGPFLEQFIKLRQAEKKNGTRKKHSHKIDRNLRIESKRIGNKILVEMYLL